MPPEPSGAAGWWRQLLAPRGFYLRTRRWPVPLALFTAFLLAVGVVWALVIAPPDYRQGDSYRILYIHVPAAFVALAGYYVMAAAGLVALVWRIKLAEMLLKSCAVPGAVMCFLALATGAIWGRPAWGSWWVWDARIVSMLVLFFLYLGVLALAEAFPDPRRGARACAILSLVGMVNVPIIYKSVDWWYSLHQGASLKLLGATTIAPQMLHPLLWMILSYYCLYALLCLLYLHLEILHRAQQSTWLKTLDPSPE